MRKLKQGTGVKGVFWDPEARGGVGEIAIRPMNLLMLYWEPGVADIQASPHFFPEHGEHQTAGKPLAPAEGPQRQCAGCTPFSPRRRAGYHRKSVVVDWYYKKPDEAGRTLLHYCKFCNGVVLYASENDPALAGGASTTTGNILRVRPAVYGRGQPGGLFGYIDVMKECQTAIDRMNHAMDENVLLASKQRYVLSDTAGVNEEELADLSGTSSMWPGGWETSFRPLQTAGLQGNSLSYRNSRIEELKEISGNRDMTQGGTAGGDGGKCHCGPAGGGQDKLSRDMPQKCLPGLCRGVLPHH